MLNYAWIIPAIPAVSFFLILFFGKRLPQQGRRRSASLAVGASFVLSCRGGRPVDRPGRRRNGEQRSEPRRHGAVQPGRAAGRALTWWQNGGIKFGVGTRIDGLAVMMLFVVTLISLLVHIYSTAYMHDDVRFTHYYAMLSLFTASMLLLVVVRQHAPAARRAGRASVSARSR